MSNGRAALAAFEVEEALGHLARAETRGPHSHEMYVQLFEQRGIAYAYLGQEDRARTAFDMLLSLDPGYALSYTLSPKVTFLFEQVRKARRERPAPELQVSWPYDAEVSEVLPIDIAVVADPKQFLARAILHVRRHGNSDYVAQDLALPGSGQVVRLELPAIDSKQPERLEVYVSALDPKGNEVLRWGDSDQPREISLTYQPPSPWWRNGWVIGGGIAAAVLATGITVFLIADSPPDLIDGTLR